MAKSDAKISKAPKRKAKKQYTMVHFEMDLFDGEFVLPKLGSLPFGVATALQNSNGGKLIEFLEEYAPDAVPAVESLEGDEIGDFMEAWGKASGVDAGK